MHWLNHVLLGVNSLLLFTHAPLSQILIFGIVFSILPDLDIVIKYAKGERQGMLRTWSQEPISIALLFVVALIWDFFSPGVFILVLLPYTLHILLDYCTVHTVHPYSPFAYDKVEVGFIKGVPLKDFFRSFYRFEFHENWFCVAQIILLTILL
ncbi:MAG TPA: metal-dependent hydrolase [Acidobacteriota bacterium]|nr:metal-dependent hydrolase [Acidobacteriota bacterium]